MHVCIYISFEDTKGTGLGACVYVCIYIYIYHLRIQKGLG